VHFRTSHTFCVTTVLWTGHFISLLVIHCYITVYAHTFSVQTVF